MKTRACLLKAVCFAFDFVGEWRFTIQKKSYKNFNDTQICYGQAFFCSKKFLYMPIAAYIRCISHYFESFIFEIFYGCQRFLSKIMSELCIACNSPVKDRRHAVTCDVCERWQHRLCGTGIYLFIYFQDRFWRACNVFILTFSETPWRHNMARC